MFPKRLDLSKITKKPFYSTDSELIKYNGSDFIIMGQLIEEVDYDFEGTYMFWILFKDGVRIAAFEDEITDDRLYVVTEEEMEKGLLEMGYNIYDSDGCTDSTLVIDYAVGLGHIPILDEDTQTYTFKLH